MWMQLKPPKACLGLKLPQATGKRKVGWEDGRFFNPSSDANKSTNMKY